MMAASRNEAALPLTVLLLIGLP